jgi:hypothetical protein
LIAHPKEGNDDSHSHEERGEYEHEPIGRVPDPVVEPV